MYFMGKMLITIKLFSLPNLIAGRKIMPEYLSVGSPTPVLEAVVDDVDRWLSDPRKLAAARDELDQLRKKIYTTGATRRVAEVLLQRLDAANDSDRVAA